MISSTFQKMSNIFFEFLRKFFDRVVKTESNTILVDTNIAFDTCRARRTTAIDIFKKIVQKINRALAQEKNFKKSYTVSVGLHRNKDEKTIQKVSMG